VPRSPVKVYIRDTKTMIDPPRALLSAFNQSRRMKCDTGFWGREGMTRWVFGDV